MIAILQKPSGRCRPALLLLCLALAAASGVATLARADTVKLSNGDVLTGTVESLADGKLVLKTEYAGEISIDAAQIVGVETAEAFTVRWDDGSEKVGRLVIGASGQIDVVAAEAPEEAEEAAAAATEAAAEYAAEEGKTATLGADTEPVDMALVDALQPIEPQFRYEGNFNLGLNLARGNSDTTDLHADAFVAPSFGRNTISIAGQLNRSEANGVTNASNWRIKAAYDRNFGVRRRWYGTLFNSYENDDLADLNLRVTAGAGFGYKFFDRRPTLLRASLGPAYVNENFKQDSDRTFLGLRWGLDFEQDLWTEDVMLYHNDNVTVGLSRTQYVLYTTTGIRVALIADLSLSGEVQWNYNAEPPPGAQPSDERFIVKIGYAFGGDENDWWQGW